MQKNLKQNISPDVLFERLRILYWHLVNVIDRLVLPYTSLNDKHCMSKRGTDMFINKAVDGRNNICGRQIAHYRKASGKSQRELADALQLWVLDVDKNAVQRIEAGKRFVTDIALTYLAKVLKVSYTELLDEKK